MPMPAQMQHQVQGWYNVPIKTTGAVGCRSAIKVLSRNGYVDHMFFFPLHAVSPAPALGLGSWGPWIPYKFMKKGEENEVN